MTVTLTIVGLGKIGASVGRSLANHTDKIYRRGIDIRPEIAAQAKSMGALDKVFHNLPSAVRDSDLVLLALPVDQIKETLSIISTELKAGAVVIDTSPAKVAVAAWAKEILSSENYYVGLTPVINPRYLFNSETGLQASQADLFEGGLMGIVFPPGGDPAAVELAADLTYLLGAKPLFSDLVEVDSLMAATHIIPQLVAAGVIGTTVNQPGWKEGGRFAGLAYALTGRIGTSMDSPESLGTAAVLNQEHVTRILDNVLNILKEMREDIAANDTNLLIKTLIDARDGRNKWLRLRQSDQTNTKSNQDVEIPTVAEEMRRWFVGRRRKK